MRVNQLDPCPLCGGEARVVDRRAYQLAYRYEDEAADQVINEFRSSYAVICTGCDLNLPSVDPEHDEELDILAESWNDRFNP